MSGYRQSSFDPSAGGDHGPPQRPYNGWQRIGVALVVAGALLVAALLIRRIASPDHQGDGWLPVGTSILLVGTALVNSRRVTISPEQCARQRRRALIVAALGLAACAFGFAAAFYSKGA